MTTKNMDTSDVIRQHVGELVTVDKEGHEIILHDADEAKLAALGKKRTCPCQSKLIC
jgi:hypothetical protein